MSAFPREPLRGILPAPPTAEDVPALPRGLPQQVESFERAVIVETLRKHQGDQPATASALAIARQTLHDKLRKLGIAADEFKA